jgi:hypothetical protein
LHPLYAPELKIAGAAVGGLIPNMTALSGNFYIYLKAQQLTSVGSMNDAEHAGFGPTTLLGLSHDYANLSNWLDQNLEPSLAKEFRKAEQQCIISDTMYAGKDLHKYFKGGAKSLSESVPVSVVNSAGVMGQRATPIAPWYLYEVSYTQIINFQARF